MLKNKSGFTLVETVICTVILAILVIASVPFLIKATDSNNATIAQHNQTIQELSDINNALASKTYDELMASETDNIIISQAGTTQGLTNLYMVKGNYTGKYGYVVIKEGSVP